MPTPIVSVPLLSEHKTTFVWNRFFETLLGGPRIFLGSTCSVPVVVYLVQLALHQAPFILGATFTVLTEIGSVSAIVSAVGCCILATLTAAFIQVSSFWIRRDVSEVVEVSGSKIPGCLLEDDDVEFESGFNLRIFRLLLPRKRFLANSVVHSLLWGLLTGYGVLYFSPTWLALLYGSSVIAYVLFFLGWMSLCVSLYSLMGNVPAEPATFHPLDRWEVRPLNRPLYVALFCCLDVLYRSSPQPYYELATISDIVFVLLPFLWFLNLVPPLDALLSWGAEQVLVVLGGGTPTSTVNRLLVQLALWCISVVVLCFVLDDRIRVCASSVLGYVLSLDLAGLTEKLLGKIRVKVCDERVGSRCVSAVWSGKEAIYFGSIFVVVMAASSGLHFSSLSSSAVNEGRFVLGLCILVVVVVTWIADGSQSVYVCFGFVRNGFYPANTRYEDKFMHRISRLRFIGTFRCAFVCLIGPFVLMAYVSMLEFEYRISAKTVTVMHVIATLRAFRWVRCLFELNAGVTDDACEWHYNLQRAWTRKGGTNDHSWQQTESALVEAFLVHIVTLCFASAFSTTDKILLLMLAAFIQDRIIGFVLKLHVFACILLSSFSNEKQRRSCIWWLLGLNVIFFPIVLVILVVSSFLSAPLLPLFTLPIFWMGFPRPTTFWPEQDRITINPSPDSIYYEEIVPELTKELAKCITRGTLGWVRPGDHFLLRYDDRLAFLSISERGYGHCVATLKGLELQQTSCHAVEAGVIDTILELAFELEVENRKDSPCRLTRNAFHVFRPCDVAIVETYVDTRNVLTGVINSPETLQLISDSFSKCFIWILLHHFVPEKVDAVPSVVRERIQDETNDVIFILNAPKAEQEVPVKSRPSTADKYAQLPRAPSLYEFLHSAPPDLGRLEDPDPWRDDEDDPLGATYPPVGTRYRSSVDRVSGFGVDDSIPTIPMTESFKMPGMVLDDGVVGKNTWTWDGGGLMAKGSSEVNRSSVLSEVNESSEEATENLTHIPKEWLNSPVPEDHLLFADQIFPLEWFHYVYEKCTGVKLDGHDGMKIESVYRRLVLSCHVIVNQVRTTGRRMSIGPCLASRIFNGDLPWSPYSDWLVQNPLLHEFVIKSYRYACKVSLDQALLGEVENESELANYLDEYDQSWFIGCDTEPSWIEAVRQRIPNLFSLDYSSVMWTPTSHLLTRRKVPVYVGRLNSEVVRSIWSTLSLELLYLTNDDEERYSIQAHQGILRNLVVQGADPPLGYPIYVSPSLLFRLTPGFA